MSNIDTISVQFLKMQPVKSINLRIVGEVLQNSNYDKSQAFQEELLNKTVCHPTALRYPPSSSYSKLFLKRVISEIEELGQEVQEGLYTAYTDLLASNDEDADFCFKTYHLCENISITLEETKKMVVAGTTGMLTWEAGCFLAEWCLKNHQLFSGKHILELGAGLGLLGLGVIAKCAPASYIFSDRHHGVLDALARNLEINISEETPVDFQRDWRDGSEWIFNNTVVKIEELDWEKKVCSHNIDIILAADVVFSKALIPALVGVIEMEMKVNEQTEVYIASAQRNMETMEFFKELLDLHGIAIRWSEEFRDCSSAHLLTVNVILMRLSKKNVDNLI